MGMLWTCYLPANYHLGPAPRVWAKYRVRLDNRVHGADYLELDPNAKWGEDLNLQHSPCLYLFVISALKLEGFHQ